MSQTLYRFFDAEDQLLYIGVTMDPPARFRSHASVQSWWEQVSDIRLESYPDRESVLLGEREAIKRERPRYNVTHNAPPPPRETVHDVLIWACEQCKQPIAPNDGYICVSYRDIHAYEEWKREVRKRHRTSSGLVIVPAEELTGGPGVAHWGVYHAACDPNPSEGQYWIDVAAWANTRETVEWMAHLLEKTWIQATDFSDLLRKIASRLPPHMRERKRAS